MQFFSIPDKNSQEIGMIDSSINSGKHMFVLVYMDGCHWCEEVRPKWGQIQDAMRNSIKNDIVVAEVNQVAKDAIQHFNNVSIDGYPTMFYIAKNGATTKIEYYDTANIPVKDRSTESFVKWIQSKSKSTKPNSKTKRGGRSKRRIRKRKTIRRRRRY
jgi:thiol-disulfide isomerase/thioredoxin